MKNISSFCQLSATQISRLENKVLIDGRLIDPKSKNSFPVFHSARMQQVCTQINCDAEDIDLAVRSATAAQKEWARRSSRQRGALLRQALPKLKSAQEEITQLLTLETSKAIQTESIADFNAALDILDFYSGLGSEIKGETVPFRPDVFTYTTREPLGVVGAILPWNVPLLLMALKIAPALVAGNSVIIKSSEYAPLSVLRFAEILNEELPPGVLNLISGYGNPTGQAFVDHPGIHKITFTGSVATGRAIYQKAAGRLIPVTLELGGKSPMIICEDADLKSVVQGAIQGMRFTRQGQSCSASSRIYVHEKLYDSFIQQLGEKLDQLRIGDPFDPSVDAGAVACQLQYNKINHYLDSIDSKYYKQYNSIPKAAGLEKGLFARPTLILQPDENHPIAKEEVFGPVTCIFKWNQLEDVIHRANQSAFGLAATAWTQNLNTALRLTRELEAGFVQINQNLVVQAALSYGGHKNSGLGKEGSLGAMIEHFTKSKTVLIKLNS